MIVNHEQRWIALRIPKTGSTTLAHVLSRAPFGGSQVHAYMHLCALPRAWLAYTIVVSVRDPLARLESMYARFVQPWGIGVDDYLEMLRSGRCQDTQWIMTQADWIRGLPTDRLRILHTESLTEDLRQLARDWYGGQRAALPVPRIHERPAPEPFPWTPDRRSIALEWAREDLDRFGYHHP